MILKSKKLVFSINLDQQTSRKKRLFWSMALFLANWPILGQIGQFNPNDPKWQKSGWNLTFIHFLCVSTVSHPITSLSFTIATLVHWLTPDVFDWIHAACAFRPEPPLCFFFYSLQGWCIVHGLDANWHKFQWCMTRVVQILARKAVPSENLRQVCVCLRVGLHAYNYWIGVNNKFKAIM